MNPFGLLKRLTSWLGLDGTYSYDPRGHDAPGTDVDDLHRMVWLLEDIRNTLAHLNDDGRAGWDYETGDGLADAQLTAIARDIADHESIAGREGYLCGCGFRGRRKAWTEHVADIVIHTITSLGPSL